MKFGNWKVIEEGVEWAGDNQQRFVIKSGQLTETEEVEDRGRLYKWILAVTDEDWLSENDLYDFNFAFVFAVAQARADFDYETFDRTVELQYELLDDEENEQPGLGDISAAEADAEQTRKQASSDRD